MCEPLLFPILGVRFTVQKPESVTVRRTIIISLEPGGQGVATYMAEILLFR